MSISRNRVGALLAATGLLGATVASAAGDDTGVSGSHVINAGVQADDASGAAFLAGLDYALSDKTWLGINGGVTQSGTRGTDIDTRSAGVTMDREFTAAALSVGLSYWGDPDELDRTGLRTALTFGNERVRLALRGEFRRYQVVVRFQTDPVLPTFEEREVDVDSPGIGATLTLRGENTSLRLRATSYDYSRDPSRLNSRLALDILSASALTLANSFIDNEVGIGGEYRFGQRLVDVDLSRDESAVDGAKTTTFALGFVTPIGKTTDLGIDLGVADPDNFDSTLFGALTFTWYGFPD